MQPNDFTRKLGANLRAFRGLRHLSAEAAGQLVGLTTDAVYKYESGLRSMSVERLVQCAVALDTNVETLLQSLDPRKPDRTAAFRELRIMTPEEHAIAVELASSWDGDVKALIFWSYLYAQIPRERRGELAMPIVMEAERMVASGQLDGQKLDPIIRYVQQATGQLLDVSDSDTGRDAR